MLHVLSQLAPPSGRCWDRTARTSLLWLDGTVDSLPTLGIDQNPAVLALAACSASHGHCLSGERSPSPALGSCACPPSSAWGSRAPLLQVGAAGQGGARYSVQGPFPFWQCHGLWCLCPFKGNFVVIHKRGQRRPYVLRGERGMCGPSGAWESLSHTPEARLGPFHSLPGTLSPLQGCCFADPVFYLIFVTFILYTVNRSF